MKSFNPKVRGRMSVKVHAVSLASAFLLVVFATIAGDMPSTKESVMTMRLDGEITVGPAGDVQGHRLVTDVQPEIRTMVDRAVRAWKFEPVLIDGSPSSAKAKMRITLTGSKIDKNYKIGFENVIFYSGAGAEKTQEPGVVLSARVKKPSPKYPKGYAVNGMVLVYVRVSPDGNIEDAIAAQSTLFNAIGKPEVLAKARKAMEDSALVAIRQWKVNVAAHGRMPTPEELTASISVDYTWRTSERTDASGQWRWENRGAQRDIPWLRDARMAQRVGVSDVNPGEMMPIVSPLRLRESDRQKLL